ncbi:NADH-quinone oxidoreductase subunit H [Rickettsiales endosymbiont of Paramecium tredecaurelia]|nr:NADH-quinone oxidoreductase subunit H [Candidatus Sarmatiella mevalonica]
MVQILCLVLPLVLFIAYLTYLERKIIGFMQLRLGPNRAGFCGLLQPIADAIKLLRKEIAAPRNSSKFLFFLAPIITFVTSFLAWAVIPLSSHIVLADINVGAMYFIATSSLGVYGIIIGGWASGSRYSMLGAIRSAAQMISYELSICLAVIIAIMVYGSMNLTQIVEAQREFSLLHQLLLMPMSAVFFIAMLAETNRLPFDIPEAESELVAGYHVEYSGIAFAFFFLGEYANMTITSAMLSILFFGGYLPPFNIAWLNFIPGFFWLLFKVCCFLFCFIWIRATLPRYRYDQLMSFGWKVLLPIAWGWFVMSACIIFAQRSII